VLPGINFVIFYVGLPFIDEDQKEYPERVRLSALSRMP
jgi:hypothetical protein